MKSFKILNVFFFSAVIISNISCSKKQPDTASVQFYIDQDIIAALNSQSSSSSLQKFIPVNPTGVLPAGLEGSGPSWSLPSPTNYNSNGCFAIFVHANEPGMMERSCLTSSGDRMFQFGPAAGLFRFNEPVQLDVTSGKDRTFYLLYMNSASGNCQNSFGQNNFDLDHTQYSAPFIVGSTTVNLDKGENYLSIDMSTHFSNSDKIETCSFMENEDHNSPQLTFNPYPSKRSVWIQDNQKPRTVNFNHNGVSVECAPTGSAFSSCTSDDGAGNGSFIWTRGLYDSHGDYQVRVTMANGEQEIFKFNPKGHYPGITSWEVCTHTYTSDSNLAGLSTLTSALGTVNSVICFKMDNLTDNSGSSINIGANNIKLIVPQGYNTFYTKTGQNNFYVNAKTGTYIAGFTLENSDVSVGPYSTIYLGSGVDGTIIEDITSNITAGANYNIYATGSTATAPIIRNSELNHQTAESSGFSVNVSYAPLELNNVTIKSNLGVISIAGDTAQVKIEDSFLETDASHPSTSYMVKSLQGGDFYIRNSTLRDGSGSVIFLATVSTDNYYLELSGNQFEKISNSQNNNKIILGGTMVNNTNVTIDSTSPNSFCSKDLVNYHFNSALIEITQGYNGSTPASPWDPTNDSFNNISSCL